MNHLEWFQVQLDAQLKLAIIRMILFCFNWTYKETQIIQLCLILTVCGKVSLPIPFNVLFSIPDTHDNSLYSKFIVLVVHSRKSKVHNHIDIILISMNDLGF